MNECVFCKIVANELPSKKVYEDDEIVAFHDIHPSAPVHMLVIPKKHIVRLSEAEESDQAILGKIQLVAQKLAIEKNISEGFKVVTNNGESAGQVVHHLHYHVLGGWKNNK